MLSMLWRVWPALGGGGEWPREEVAGVYVGGDDGHEVVAGGM